MFKCLVIFIELFSPFSYSRIVILLSWFKIVCSTLYHCDYIKILVHNIRLDLSYAPTNLASVLLFVFIFCFHDTDTIDPLPIVNVSPLWYLKSKCTANYSSTYNFRQIIIFAFNLRRNYLVPTIYFISLRGFFQYPWLGYFTIVRKTAIVGWMSGLDLFTRKNL